VKKILVSYDGSQLVSISYDKTIRVWDVASGTNTRTFSSDHIMSDIVWWKNNEYLVECGGSSLQGYYNINIIKFSTGKIERSLKGHTNMVRKLVIDGNTLYSCSSDNSICKWDLDTGIMQQFEDWCYDVVNLCLIETQVANMPHQILVSGGMDKSLKFWNVNTRKCTVTIKDALAYSNCSLEFCKPHQLLITASRDGKIKMWNISNYQPTYVIEYPHASLVTSMQLCNNESQLLVGDENGNMMLWDFASTSFVRVFQNAHARQINSFAIMQN